MGWYRMHRGWMEDDLWKYNKYSSREAWCWLIENAKYEDEEEFIAGELVKIERGSLVQTERQLAKKWKWGRQKVRTFLKNLKKVGKVDVKLTQKITQIYVLNYNTYQKEQPKEQPTDNPAITQQQPSYKEEKKERSKELKKVNGFTINKKVYKKEFEEFYNLYPRKTGKRAAAAKHETITKEVSHDKLIKSVTAYAESVKSKEKKYIPHPASWLNAGRWDDELEEPEFDPIEYLNRKREEEE